MRVPGPPTKVQFARPLYSGGRVGALASGLACITSMCLTVPFAGNVKGGLKGQACTVCSSRTTATNSKIAARCDVFFGILLCYGVKRCCERAQRSFGRCRNFEDQQNSGCEIHALRDFSIAAHQRGEKCLVTSYVGGWPPSRPSAVFLRSSVTSTCRRCQGQVTPTAPWSTMCKCEDKVLECKLCKAKQQRTGPHERATTDSPALLGKFAKQRFSESCC